MNNQIIPFDFENRQTRVIVEGGEIWFVAQDVARALEYPDSSSPARLFAHVPDEWKGVNPIHTPGGIQNMLCLSEQGLYFFLGRSDKRKALPFQKKIAGEILPRIRKTGAYIPDDALQNIRDLQERVLELEINRSVTEKSLHNALRTVRRYEEQRLMTYADKREILNLRLNNYRVSDIQRVTKKSREAIKRFLNRLADLGDDEFEAEIEKIKRAGRGYDMGELIDSFIAASRGRGDAV
jgi:prophage antirepressor-like protein